VVLLCSPNDSPLPLDESDPMSTSFSYHTKWFLPGLNSIRTNCSFFSNNIRNHAQQYPIEHRIQPNSSYRPSMILLSIKLSFVNVSISPVTVRIVIRTTAILPHHEHPFSQELVLFDCSNYFLFKITFKRWSLSLL
jgi:hypothetical protein